MDIRNRLMAPIATSIAPRVEGSDDVVVDVGALLLALILYDTFILDSIQLTEVPHLVRVFGYDGVISLLESGLIEIHCDAVSIGQVGQTTGLPSREGRGPLPLGSYAFADVRMADRKDYIHHCLQWVNDIPGLRKRQQQRLKQAIASRLVETAEDAGRPALVQLRTDLIRNVPTVADATALALRRDCGISASALDFSTRIHQISDDGDVAVDTDIAMRFNLNEKQAHSIAEQALLGVAALNLRTEYMKRYSALSGVREGELPLFEGRLDFLVDQFAPEAQSNRFHRVMSALELPDLAQSEEPIDVNRLLVVARSDECREFRQWLRTTDSISDIEIQEHLQAVRARLSSLARSTIGRALRFLFTTSIGTVAPPAGVAIGILDGFLLDRMLSESGPTSFVNDLYPSIFTRQDQQLLQPDRMGVHLLEHDRP